MMSRLLFFLGCWVGLSTLATAQFEYGNDWYRQNAGQDFVKLTVTEDGIYRVYKQDLIDAGYDVENVNQAFLKLYYRGQEVPLFVARSGNSFAFLEFFGRFNDGDIDSILYRDPINGTHATDEQPNDFTSIFDDRSAYFLTWGRAPGSARYFSLFDPTYGLYTPEPHFRYRSLINYGPGDPGAAYINGGGGAFDPFFTLNSDYITGEGFVGPAFSPTNTFLVNVPTPDAVITGRPMTVQTRVYGRSNSPHDLLLTLDNDDARPIVDTTILISQVYIKTFTGTYLPGAPLGDEVELAYRSRRTSTDNNHVCWTSITYDRTPNLAGDSTIAIQSWDKTQRSLLELEEVRGNDSLYVYDVSNRIRHIGLIDNDRGRIIIQGFPNSRDLFLATDVAIKKPVIESAAFGDLFQPDRGADFVIIAPRGLSASAEAYQTYRASASVNPKTATVVYTDDIYNEFSYGSVTPLAIKRFCKYALDNWQVKPTYFLLWGKGYNRTRGRDENDFMVPTFGYPATDYEYVGHFDESSTDLNLEAAIGRVNLFNDQEGLAYLAKVDQYEHTSWDGYFKEAVHLGGGASQGEQLSIGDAFDFFLEQYLNEPLGGNTFYFQKTSSDVQIDPADATYHEKISEGVGLIHFFGHSTSNILDISIRFPSEYNNFGRYPLMLAMGCYGGDFTASGTTFGERWVKEPGRGSIGYLANSSAGYLQPLKDFGRVLYTQMFQINGGQSIGVVMRNTLNTYTDSLVGIQFRNHGRQLNLQGDPAIQIKFPELPDLAIDQTSISFEPENFTAQDDSFRINIAIQNQGLATTDSFQIQVSQRLPSGDTYVHPIVKVKGVIYQDSISFILKNPVGNEMTGQNTFEVYIDAEDVIQEYTEANNIVRVDRLVPGNIPAILYPTEYAIIGENNISLQASAFFMTAETDVAYVFEIDTTAQFDSPAKVSSGTVIGKATFAEWQVPFTLKDSAVYFWRVRLQNVQPSVWSSASFRYIADQVGWGQARFSQFDKSDVSGITSDRIQQEWLFGELGIEFEFRVIPTGVGNFQTSRGGSLVFNAGLNGLGRDKLIFFTIDPVTLTIRENEFFFGPFGFINIPAEVYKLRDAITNAREGDYIVVATYGSPNVNAMPDDIYDLLEAQGVSSTLRLLKTGEPFLVFTQKGNLNNAIEIYAPNQGNDLVIRKTLVSRSSSGAIRSTRIGPSLNWQSLDWNWRTNDRVLEETAVVEVYGERADGTDSLVFSNLAKGIYDLSTVNANTFPYMRLNTIVEDTVNRTAPQLNDWQVYYVPAPDAVVDLDTDFEFRSDTIFEGQELYLRMGARNIGQIDMDSLKVALWIEREDRSTLVLDTLTIAPLLANGPTVPFEYRFNSNNKGLSGDILFSVEVNPGQVEPEQNQFNNIFVQPVHVINDLTNPLMDVTFDGKHIMDGDFVSPQPEILIEINDDNEFIAITDSTAFEVYFKAGIFAGIPTERLQVPSDSRVRWEPASLPENRARLYFYPGQEVPLQDTTYTLRIQGTDQNGNAAGEGSNYYEITFRVENQSTITNVFNYPNPFSSATRFVYTLTGAMVPEVFQLHIYTISGKLVKVVDFVELGEVFVGNNITNYAWDGTDEYGDALANGVYLYRTVVRMPGQEIELRDQNTSQYFKNGWGKMVIMR